MVVILSLKEMGKLCFSILFMLFDGFLIEGLKLNVMMDFR